MISALKPSVLHAALLDEQKTTDISNNQSGKAQSPTKLSLKTHMSGFRGAVGGYKKRNQCSFKPALIFFFFAYSGREK